MLFLPTRFGPMMMATLHGLTRSRPDLLTESLTTFSTFTAPAKMPKDEIGAHLEAKLAEGEVLREFERIPKRKLDNSGKSTEFKPKYTLLLQLPCCQIFIPSRAIIRLPLNITIQFMINAKLSQPTF